MPYIPKQNREDILSFNCEPRSAGELNFKLTEEIKFYLERKGTTYTSLNEIIGVLQCIQQEFYRRVVVPYEDKKIKENGDVY